MQVRGCGVRADQSCLMPPSVLGVPGSLCLSLRNLRKSGSKGGKFFPSKKTRCWGWEVTGLASAAAREAAIPVGNTARPKAAASQTAAQGLEQEDTLSLRISTELQSPSPSEPGSGGFGVFFNFSSYCFVGVASQPLPLCQEPCKGFTRGDPCAREVSVGDF